MRTIRVTGKGQLKVHPDMTRITMELKGGSREYGETLEKSAKETEQLKDILAPFGFDRTDLKTLRFDVETLYESYQEKKVWKERFNGYQYAKWHSTFQIFEYVSVAVFTIEYILRIWTADLLYPDSKHPRLKYIFSFMAIIDLLAILLFYLPFILADLRFLRMMRLFRLFRLLRVFKLGRYFEALQVIMKVIRTSGPQLVMSVALCFFVMLFSAIIMYTVENPVQPEQFPNVVSSLWWAMCTLTTVGYGDVYPITAVGKFFASVISLVGIGIIAIPTGIIAAGFNHAIDKTQEDKEEKDATNRDKDVDNLDEDELISLQVKVAERLKEYGHTATIIIAGKEQTETAHIDISQDM